MDVQEALRLLERMRREREVLENSYTDIIDDLENTPVPDNPLQLFGWLCGITTKLADYEQMEREQNTMLMQLLGQTIARLVQATSTSTG